MKVCGSRQLSLVLPPAAADEQGVIRMLRFLREALVGGNNLHPVKVKRRVRKPSVSSAHVGVRTLPSSTSLRPLTA